MHKVGIVALVGLLAFGLAGCGEEESNDASARAAGETAEVGEAGTPAPLVAETPEATPAGEPSPGPSHSAAEAAYLADVRSNLRETTSIPDASDDQLLISASEACKQLTDGVYITQVSVIEGEPADDTGYLLDSLLIAAAGQEFLCPETIKQ